MIYFLNTSSVCTPIKRFGQLLLKLPVSKVPVFIAPVFILSMAVLIAGCDNSTSAPEPIDEQPDITVQNEPSVTQNERIEEEKVAEDYSTSDSEGQSLIAAAKTDGSKRNHSSDTSADTRSNTLQATLMGDYDGMLPCATCDNIEVVLNLFSDGTVTKTSTFVNAKPARANLIEHGIYRQDQDIINIVFDNKDIETYLIQNNHLIMMDDNDMPSDDHILSRQ